jgi:hypothetical protein
MPHEDRATQEEDSTEDRGKDWDFITIKRETAGAIRSWERQGSISCPLEVLEGT